MEHNTSRNTNEINKLEHDEVYQVKKVSNFVSDGEGNLIREGSVGLEDSNNSSSTTLAADGVFTGTWTDTLNYNNIIVGIISTEDSATDGLAIQWSHDGTHVDDDDVFTILGGNGKVFTFAPARRYVRIVYTNGSTGGDIDLQTIFKKGGIKSSSHRIQDNIVAEDDAILMKSVITGQKPNGDFTNFQSTSAGNFKVSLEEYDAQFETNPLPVGLTSPLSTFGELITVEPTPVIQMSNQYQLDPSNRSDLEVFEATGGSADNIGNLFRCQTGTSAGGYGVIRSKEAVIYRPGEGFEGLITATFTAGVANSIQFAGLFSLTETVAFGYDGTDFSTIFSEGGTAEVQSIQVTGAASSAANCTVTIDGDAVVIALSTSTVQTNAKEICDGLQADGTVSGKWRVEQVDDTVFVIAKSVGNKTGTFSFAAGSTGATATVTEKTAGVDKTHNHTAQADWNVTTSPFSGFDPTNINIYKLSLGYLGAASINFSIYNPNTGRFVLVHRQMFASNQTTTSMGSPDLKIGWTAASLGSSGTNLTVTGASCEAAVEGKELIRNNTFATDNSVSGVGTTLTAILSIKNRIIYGDRFNLGKIFPLDVSIDNDHNKGVIIELYVNATLGGTINYQYEDEYNSIALVDKAGTTVTGGTLVDAFTVPAGGDVEIDLKKLSLTLSPEDVITVAAKTISGTSTAITGAFVWQEEK